MSGLDAAQYCSTFVPQLQQFKLLEPTDRQRFIRLVQRFLADLQATHDRMLEY